MKQLRELADKIHKLEEDLLFNQEEDFSKNFKTFLEKYTELGSSIGAILIILITAFAERSFQLFVIFISVYLFQLIVIEIIKALFSRTRPNSTKHRSIFGVQTTKGSFPSGHASNIFTLAFLLTNYYGLGLFFTVILYVIAGSIATSRLLLGKHYLVDVIVGALLGIILSYFATYMTVNIIDFLNT